MKLTNKYLLTLSFFFIPFSISFGETLENNLYSLNSKDNGSEVRVFGVGEKSNDKTYSGLGIEYKDDQSQAGLENGDEYQKLYGVYKYALPQSFYIKGGLGYLKKEVLFGADNIDIKQYTLGTSVGWGDDKNYNIELGYVGNKLRDAYEANGYTNTAYIEALGQYELEFTKDWGTLEAMLTYQNSHVYHNNYSGLIAQGAYYPIEDIRTFVQYNDALQTDENDYRITLGVKYAFASKTWSPILTAQANTSNSVSYGIVYDEDIENDPLSNRDFFESQVSTTTFKAQELASNEFNQRLNKSLNPRQKPNVEPSNSAPTGESFTVSAGWTKSVTVDLSSHIHDADGDALTINIVGKRHIGGLPYTITVTKSGTNVTVAYPTSVGLPTYETFQVMYTVSDGENTSEVYTMTIAHLKLS
ncbi:MAG: hypothetical protein K8R39_02770 [Arcobacteraceae bacterium]|nr:hypothetical protein [Arcobacteraceae bacterium]